jgi:membrane protease YdiL (CAAX protease family)
MSAEQEWGGGLSPVQAELSAANAPANSPDQVLASNPLSDTPPNEPPRDPVWTGLDVFRLLIMAILAIIVSGLAMLAVVHGASLKARTLSLSARPELLIVAQMLAYGLLLAYMYVLVTKERRRPRFWKALHWNWPANIWPYLFIGFAMQIVFVFLERFLPFPKQTPFDDLLQRHTAIILIAVFAVTLGPLMEELFFRGFLYPVLARRFGMVIGIFLTAIGFGVMHLAQYGYSWASVLLIFVVGMVLGVVRAKKDSVAAGFVVHMAYNGTIAVAMFAATDGFRHLEKLSQ